MNRMATLLGLALALLASAGAQATDRPARLLVGEQSIETHLRLPKSLPNGTFEVYCEAVILKKGRAFRPYCYSNKQLHYQRLVESTERAIRRAHYSPAIRGGVAVDVYMLMMAIVTISDREPLVLVVPNNGLERKRYGLLYTAPQRINNFTWRYPLPPLLPRERSVLVWKHLSIDAEGKVTDKRLENASGASEIVLRAIDGGIDQMVFMPGELDGKPVPMRYVEPSFSR